MSRTEQKFLNLVKEYKLINERDKILVALSGGPDSVFLLYLLTKFQLKFKITICSAHLNHSLRGKSSEEDQHFCEELSQKLNVQFFTKKLDIQQLSRRRKKSIEETAREERYLFFDETADTEGYNKIATAHNSNDNSETVLLNLIKGTGLKGIAGIPLVRGRIIRPILNITKEEILEYLGNNKIPFRTDITNESEIYERNIIRLKILPVIRKLLNPSVDKSIFNSSRTFRDELQLINHYLKSLPGNLITFENGAIIMNLVNISAHDESIIGEMLRQALSTHFQKDMEYDDFKKVKDLMIKQTGKRIFLSGKLLAFKERGKIYIKRNTGISNVIDRITVKLDESCFFENNEIKILQRKSVEEFSSTKYNEIISADDLEESFLLRKWKNGDKFIPLGMKNFKKVSDFLTEQKIPSYKRKDQLVLINKDKIIWLPGIRIDERVKIRRDTKRIYELWMKQSS